MRAIDCGPQTVELAEAQGSQPMRILGYHGFGASLVLGGHWEEARSALEHALALMEEGRTFRHLEGACLACLAEALLGLGELERARDTARVAVRAGARNGWSPECEAQLALAQVLTDPVSPIPMVGASGAIAGVLGAYVLLHPKARILVLNPVFLLWFLVGPLLVFPAWLALGTWFVWNLLGILGAQVGQAGGMVAFFAHIGGFLAGVILIWPAMVGRKRRKARPWDGWHPPPRRRSLPPSGPHQDPWFPPDRPR